MQLLLDLQLIMAPKYKLLMLLLMVMKVVTLDILPNFLVQELTMTS